MKKTFEQEIDILWRKFEKKYNVIFSKFKNEKKKQHITTIVENNKLWNEKYKSALEKAEKEYDAKNKKVFNKHFPKKIAISR